MSQTTTEAITTPESEESVELQLPEPSSRGELASGGIVQKNINDEDLLAEAMAAHNRPQVPPPELTNDPNESLIIFVKNISENSTYDSKQSGSQDKKHIESSNVLVRSKISNTQENKNGSKSLMDIGNNTHSHSERKIQVPDSAVVREFGNRDKNYERTLTQGERENTNVQEEIAKNGEQEEKAKLEEHVKNPVEQNAPKYRGGIFSDQKIPLPK